MRPSLLSHPRTPSFSLQPQHRASSSLHPKSSVHQRLHCMPDSVVDLLNTIPQAHNSLEQPPVWISTLLNRQRYIKLLGPPQPLAACCQLHLHRQYIRSALVNKALGQLSLLEGSCLSINSPHMCCWKRVVTLIHTSTFANQPKFSSASLEPHV